MRSGPHGPRAGTRWPDRLDGRLALQLFANLADVGGDRVGIRVAFRFAQTLGGDTGRVARERREAAFLCMGRDAGEFQELESDLRVELGLLDLRTATLGRLRPAFTEGLEELIHQARTLAPRLRRRKCRSKTGSDSDAGTNSP